MPGRRTFLPVAAGNRAIGRAIPPPSNLAFRHCGGGSQAARRRACGGALHDVIEGGPAAEFSGSATLFTAGIAARLQRPGSVVPQPARSLCAGSRECRAASGPGDLRGDLPRAGHPARHGRGIAGKGSGGGDRGGHPARADRLAPASTGGRNLGRAGFHPAPLVECVRERNSPACRAPPPPDGASHLSSPMRRRPRALPGPAGRWIFCAAAAANPIPGFSRLAMRRVVSLYLPTWPTDRIRRPGGTPPPDEPLVTVQIGRIPASDRRCRSQRPCARPAGGPDGGACAGAGAEAAYRRCRCRRG